MLDYIIIDIKTIAEIAAVISAIIAVGSLISKYFKRKNRIKSWREKEITKLSEVADNLTLNLVKSHKFVNTMGQAEPPHEYENIYCSPKRYPLINRILKEVQKKDNIDKKRYIIMGGSGMGKSTFSAALFYKYVQIEKSKKNPTPIFIKSLSNPNVIEDIQDLCRTNTEQSIIILDALDENIDAAQDINAFMDKLEAVTRGFRIVIITCRTQFFENEEIEPDRLKIKITGASKRTLEYQKVFISPFTVGEAKKYLRKKFGLRIKDYYKATRISKRCWDVLSRPMILSFVDDLMELDNIKSLTAAEIYSKIIDKWFDREIEFQDVEKTDLFSFSKKISLYMYNKWLESKSPFIAPSEYQHFLNEFRFDKSPYSFRARSLINRTSGGAIKFAHKSFWEFFLAINAFEHPEKSFVKNGLEMAVRFSEELSSSIIEKRNINIPIERYRVYFDVKENQKSICLKILKILKRMHKYYDVNVNFSYLDNENKIDDDVQVNLYILLYKLWESTILSIVDLFNEISSNNTDFQKKAISKQLYKLNRKLILTLSNIFLTNGIEEKSYIKLVETINSLLKSHDECEEWHKPYYESNIGINTIFPYPTNNSKLFRRNDKLLLSCYGVGYGFYNTADRMSFVSDLLKHIDGSTLFVYITAENTNELSKLISSFYGIISSSIIVFIIHHNSGVMHYYLDLSGSSNYGAKKLKTILDNLYSTAITQIR